MATPATKPRLFCLDWLRVLAMATVFLYHNNRFFNSEDWHVKNAAVGGASDIVNSAISLWMMPLLFVLSGAAVYYSLKSRSAGGFRRERFLRLMVPFLTLGLFVLGPLQIYLERLSHGQFAGSFWAFYPHYFQGFYGFGGNFAWMGVHLWYLLLLFLFSLLFLPLCLPRGERPSPLARLAGRLHSLGMIYLLVLPLMLAPALADALGLGITRGFGGWDIFSYLLLFAYGYLLFANPRTQELLIKRHPFSLVLALILSGVLFALVAVAPDFDFPGARQLLALVCFAWVVAFLGLGGYYLNFKGRYLSYANEAVLPFYVLHQPVILVIGYFVVQWNLPIPAKYFLIAGSSFAAIMLIYELLVRRVGVLRFLFGMKPAPKAEAAPGEAAPA